jgi:hypothetical protein
MSTREFRSPDGRRWRVWAVQPDALGRAIRIGAVGERRRRERRLASAEAPADRLIFRRRRIERRVAAATARRAPSDVLPAPWCDGWLVFRSDPAPADGARESRRLAPIPAGWDALSEEELARLLQEAAPPATR